MPTGSARGRAAAAVIALSLLAGCSGTPGRSTGSAPTGPTGSAASSSASLPVSDAPTKDAAEPTIVQRNSRVQLWSRPGTPLPPGLLQDATFAADAVLRDWKPGGAWRTQLPRLWIAASAEQFVTWGGDPNPAIAATTTQDGVVLVSPKLAASSTQLRRFVLTHELTHSRLGVRSAAPMWVTEGAAERTAWRASGLGFAAYAPSLTASIRAGTAPTTPPTDAELASSGSIDDLQLAYQRAAAWSDFLARTGGEEGYRRYVVLAIVGRDTFVSAFGATGQQLRPAFSQYLRTLIGA